LTQIFAEVVFEMKTQPISPNNKRTKGATISLMRVLVTFLILGAVLTSSIRVRATPLDGSVGSISLVGTALVNGQNATSGQTLFSKSRIVTSSKSESMIDFANAAHLRVAEQTDLSVESSANHVAVVLSQGDLKCLVPNGISFDLRTTDASINISPDEPVIFDVTTTECAGTTISVEKGQLQISAAENERTLTAGETLTTVRSPPNKFHLRKQTGLWILIGAAVGVLLAAVIGSKPTGEAAPFFGGCVVASGEPTC